MKKIIVLYIIISSVFLNAQSTKTSSDKNTYISIEGNYRSYGTGDIVGMGYGIEFSKDIKKWFGLGINLSYWSNEKLSWDFYDPYTLTNFKYYDQINELKISPFVQLMPLNTKYVDFYIQSGVKFGHYNQVYQSGGYITDYSYTPKRVFSYVNDIGYKGITLGYELGLALRFQFGKFIVVPSSIYSNDLEGNSFNSLNLKLGWQL